MITTISIERVQNGFILRNADLRITRVTESHYLLSREIEQILRDSEVEAKALDHAADVSVGDAMADIGRFAHAMQQDEG